MRARGRYPRRVTSPVKPRLFAGLIDLGVMLAWALVAGGAVLALATTGNLGGGGLLGVNLIGVAAVVLPVTLGLSTLEAGRYEATPGKLALGLRVRRDPGGDRIGWGRSFLRNLLKLGLPWTLLHLSVLSVVVAPGPSGWLGLALALAVPSAYLISLRAGRGRTIYDHLAGTMVISTAPGRRFAD